ncbi:hypothetical protein [Bradyrhizobium japonicum]|jgi:hypothetical protein|uniref:hypothetical protein n=1 Tax=Bradyrhizobium japonicum TaxID=375 RepID=UPI00209D4EDC|nr:hypothetical protein [Bradyrhizobium japonicum]MCP1766797.1 hypothetical protein [Bradyrhizobium japonicum]MCP1788936.1 hypothetical protein [Bradyrhizobium japonicum]MCP1801435.1 hypothetical protein [Bradyrhizobium japonicum]MCP1819744.1 hypothetical protein [Bradyrhizobium japonicum]MCP1868746.1 hypothetical protein [Bradyrhizobium japonicum]
MGTPETDRLASFFVAGFCGPPRKMSKTTPCTVARPRGINDLRAAKLHGPELAIARPQFDTSGKTLASCHHPESLIASCERPPIMAPVTGPLRAMR